MSAPSVAVVVITYKRSRYINDCLSHLLAQTTPANQIIVVDGSPDDLTADIVRHFPTVTYLRNPAGAGNMTSSRNAALSSVDADVIAFLDDDANAAPSYIAELISFCDAHPDVAIGCCRALNGVAGEEATGVDVIGTLSRTGRIHGNFGADPGKDIEIDHGLGATMWITTDLMSTLGGFREYFAGTSACEDTDLFLRARKLGHRPWFVHAAVVQHVAAPQEGGQRFDRRYTYWSAHNSAIMQMADSGFFSARFLVTGMATVLRNLGYGGRPHRRLARTAIVAAAWVRGTVAAWRLFGAGPRTPVGWYRRPATR